MQIIILSIIVFIVLAFVMYKVTSELQKKKFGFFAFFIIFILACIFAYFEYKSDDLPTIFKTNYQKVHKIKIYKLSSQKLNNKNISSKTKFVYKFTYIVNENNKEYICIAPNVQIDKVANKFIVKNLENIIEDCTLI